MNYNKVIKDLKERNDKLQEQYRLRDIRCIHLEYENEMLKSDFKAQHELTKKYAEENQELKSQLKGTTHCFDEEEHEKLKKQLEEKENIACNWKDNWNKLREYIKETKLKEFEKDYGKRYGKTFTQAEIVVCNMILDKMQELEQGSDSNE